VAPLLGLFSLIYGISQIVPCAELRQTEHNAHRIMEQAALASSWSAPGSARGGE